jgi:hypothetical protein
MMKMCFRRWLEQKNYVSHSITSRIAETARVEKYHGDLDQHYDRDSMQSLIEMLRYSTDDQRRDRANPSKIPINGDIRNNLATYQSGIKLYCKFRGAVGGFKKRASAC